MDELGQAVDNTGKNMKMFGIITIILGVLAIMAPAIAGESVVLIVGVLVGAAGAARMVWAFQASGFGRGLLVFGIGLLTLLCGIALIAHPFFASGVLTIMLAVYFVVDGFFEITAGLQRRPEEGWGWMLFGGILSLFLGYFIFRQYPFSGTWAIGVLLGLKLLFVGMMMLTTGSAVREAAAE